jgi:transposase
MVLVRARMHPRGLGLNAQRKVFVLRKSGGPGGKKLSWEKIAPQVKNLKNKTPGWKVCRDAYNKMNSKEAKVEDNYSNCGRDAVLTKSLRTWLVSRLLVLRKSTECTSGDLARELAKKKGVVVEASTVRRALNLEGYKHLSRSKKPKYSKEQREERVAFAKMILAWCKKDFEASLNLCLDGVVFTIPPSAETARENYCHSDCQKVWRKPGETALTELDGFDRYKNQVPDSRIIPLWGGLASGGFAPVLWHPRRKTDTAEWSEAIKDGALLTALRAVNPRKRAGPWKILCDNETFLRAGACLKLYEKLRIELLKLPAKSPDLNPVEKMWGWARKRLRGMDLADLAAHRPVLGKFAYKDRIKRLLKTAKAQTVAKNFMGNLRTVAARVVNAKGAAVRG